MESSQPSVLVVDDNEALRENIAECLEGEGWSVALAASGAEALARLEEQPLPRVALVDLQMPGMNGGELIAAIRSNPRWSTLRLVLSTGDSAVGPRPPTGVDAILRKPFGVKELLRTLGALTH